jgi:hypothetical protein
MSKKLNVESAAAVAGAAPCSAQYRIVSSQDVICAGDEQLCDDCETWEVITHEFVDIRYNGNFFVPMRRKVSPCAAPHGSAAGVSTPNGVCIVCGSGLLLQYWRGHPGNQRIHCNDCGSEVTPWMHAKQQPNAKLTDSRP